MQLLYLLGLLASVLSSAASEPQSLNTSSFYVPVIQDSTSTLIAQFPFRDSQSSQLRRRTPAHDLSLSWPPASTTLEARRVTFDPALSTGPGSELGKVVPYVAPEDAQSTPLNARSIAFDSAVANGPGANLGKSLPYLPPQDATKTPPRPRRITFDPSLSTGPGSELGKVVPYVAPADPRVTPLKARSIAPGADLGKVVPYTPPPGAPAQAPVASNAADVNSGPGSNLGKVIPFSQYTDSTTSTITGIVGAPESPTASPTTDADSVWAPYVPPSGKAPTPAGLAAAPRISPFTPRQNSASDQGKSAPYVPPSSSGTDVPAGIAAAPRISTSTSPSTSTPPPSSTPTPSTFLTTTTPPTPTATKIPIPPQLTSWFSTTKYKYPGQPTTTAKSPVPSCATNCMQILMNGGHTPQCKMGDFKCYCGNYSFWFAAKECGMQSCGNQEQNAYEMYDALENWCMYSL
ncbi:MAG: hypothetical protein Q9162_005814 [Coniocarpon cinnabarinum]